MKLENKVAIVTGAGSGNGRAIALRYLQEGAKVVIADINLDGAEATRKMATENSESIAIKVDVTNKHDVENMVKKTVEEFGEINILVNNAGIVAFSSFLEISEDEWDKVHNVNLKGPFLCSQAVSKVMIEQGNAGRIVNITSVEAHRVVSSSGECQPHYNSSKGGLLMLSKAMASELAKHKITVNNVAPGVVDTPFTQENLKKPEIKKWILDRVPIGRVAQPEDIANATLFLASDDSGYITGTTIFVDGGWTVH
ncbi:SDR family NAD(P)-dependent oxidoreductase [Psychrobacillus sp. NEAU-3TGS]|uniref:SDR family NAD(P)-dependent oxidoreductase n=1 Tax=Psychrobacillus sp. NEAU-3TGS TaxID=2995412 RepID=UPI00249685F3|nr:SDR family NAD(P)-dependent oxidoreductase [Psychrobacillus sp. NEAU-3TGS]MDI2587637.1 SDR family NAD(P)-dependent oxidoreductase [Psychrobacillus sp. NEAU-3TGS]